MSEIKNIYFNFISEIKLISTNISFEESETFTEYFFSLNNNDNQYWISLSKNETEITIGFNAVHKHYCDLPYELNESFDYFKSIISNEIEVTLTYNGDVLIKSEYDIVESNVQKSMGNIVTHQPFWKKSSNALHKTKTIIPKLL